MTHSGVAGQLVKNSANDFRQFLLGRDEGAQDSLLNSMRRMLSLITVQWCMSLSMAGEAKLCSPGRCVQHFCKPWKFDTGQCHALMINLTHCGRNDIVSYPFVVHEKTKRINETVQDGGSFNPEG